MFKFLKEKLKKAVSSIGKKVEKEVPEEETPIEEVKEDEKKEEQLSLEKKPEKEKKSFFARFKRKEVEEEPKKIEKKERVEKKKFDKEEVKVVEGKKEEIIEGPEEKKGFFGVIKEKIVTKKISEEKFGELFFDLEIALLENNVALEVVEKIKEDLKEKLVDKPILRGKIEGKIQSSLRDSINDLFSGEDFDFVKKVKSKKPFVILFLGVNGSGKTTTISKIAQLCLDNKLSVVLGAGDSFRRAAIEQLEEWGKQLGVKVIKHEYGSDPAAVCFDTVKYAESKSIDVVLLDTAGRQQSNKNLMEELKKINRVAKPDLKIFVGESLVGNDAVIQSQDFDKAVGVDGVILTKADVDEKGGAMISVSYVTGKPILFLGLGQKTKDLKRFDSEEILGQLNL